MKAVLQRVTRASVHVDGALTGEIEAGLVALVGVTHGDTDVEAATLARKIYDLRIMRGEVAVSEVPAAAILVVSQFTLYADTRKGRRPSWSAAAPGPVAEPLIDAVVSQLRSLGATVAIGTFGADMRVELVNDGPMTLLLEV